MIRCLTFLALIAVLSPTAFSQDAKKEAPKKKPSPALDQVKDVPGLPRVLLIGDSISMGYHVPTRTLLKDVANVHRPNTNCGPTTNGVAHIDEWLGDGKWDVIHFNFGLHDLKYVDEDKKPSTVAKGKLQVPLDEYRKNLETLVARMKKTNAKLIFATTTPVPAKEPMRKENSDKDYNAVALEVMKSNGVTINDLNALVRGPKFEGQKPNNVHFTDGGSKALAEQVAAAVKAALGK
jgi:hypothetical protein